MRLERPPPREQQYPWCDPTILPERQIFAPSQEWFAGSSRWEVRDKRWRTSAMRFAWRRPCEQSERLPRSLQWLPCRLKGSTACQCGLFFQEAEGQPVRKRRPCMLALPCSLEGRRRLGRMQKQRNQAPDRQRLVSAW